MLFLAFFTFFFFWPLARRNICCKFLLPFGTASPSARPKWYQLFALVKTVGFGLAWFRKVFRVAGLGFLPMHTLRLLFQAAFFSIFYSLHGTSWRCVERPAAEGKVLLPRMNGNWFPVYEDDSCGDDDEADADVLSSISSIFLIQSHRVAD